MATINPYLNFNGTCEEAFNFYKSIFGGEFQSIMRYKDTPPDVQMPRDPGKDNNIMHVALPIGGNTLMGSDWPKMMGTAMSNSFSVSINTDTEAEAKNLFDSLSSEGKVTMPLAQTFWGSLFGMLTDRYGISWMVSYAEPQRQQG